MNQRDRRLDSYRQHSPALGEVLTSTEIGWLWMASGKIGRAALQNSAMNSFMLIRDSVAHFLTCQYSDSGISTFKMRLDSDFI